MKKTRISAIALFIVSGAACNQTENVNPDPVQPSQSTSDTGTEDLYASACPSGTSGAQMVLIEDGDGSAYCVDERETSYGDYKEFLDAKAGDTSGQPDECKWNDSFVPPLHANHMECGPADWQIDNLPDRPVECVDFCDAWAYCDWAGKRLCGIRGSDNNSVHNLGVTEFEQVGTSVQSEWFNACSQGGRTKYPYGDEYAAAICTDQAKVQSEGDDARNVTDLAGNTCHGTIPPFDAVYDLSASVMEWSNLCGEDGCAAHGGAFYYGEDRPERLACTRCSSTARSERTVGLGIRCCADAVQVPRTETSTR